MVDWKQQIRLSDLVPARLRNRVAARLRKPRWTAKQPRRRDARPLELVGLKIGASQLIAAHVADDGSRELRRLVTEPLAPGIVTGGEVRDPAALAAALDALFTRNELPRRGVRLGLANSRIGVRVLEISGIEDEQQLENAIGFRAHEMLSVPLDEAVIDYHVLEEEVDEDGHTTRRVLLVVAYRDSVDRYLAATDAAGIELVGIDLEAFALLRALSEPPAGEDPPEAAVVAVSVGHERTTLAISDGRVCEFTRVLEWGGSELSSAIGRALKITPAEADEIKRELSFEDDPPAPKGVSKARAAEALGAARFELSTLVRELLSSLRFYQSQPGSLAIGEILLSGGMADMPGFAGELERELGVRVRIADPLARVRLADTVERPRELGSLAVAVGLGIED